MKRIVLLIFSVVLCGAIQAQTYDTVSGKNGVLPHYYYPEGWFDTPAPFIMKQATLRNDGPTILKSGGHMVL